MITVVGAGVVGCAIAFELAARGAHVRVIDPRPIGGGATHASAGMLAPYIEGHDAALRSLGLASLALYDDLMARLDAENEPVEYERSGSLQVATTAEEAAQLAAHDATLRTLGASREPLDAAGVRAFEPMLTTEAVSGLMTSAHGYVNASALTRALAAAAARHGARFTTERVLGVSGCVNSASVTSSEGTIEGEAVVLAAGTWSPGVAGIASWPPPVKPVRGQLLHLRAPARVASRIVWGAGCYLVPWRDGTTLIGATVEDVGFDERATAGGVRQLLDAAVGLVPSLRDAAFLDVRVGLRPKTGDELPIIGPSSTMPRVFYATGHYRNGILLTPLTAMMIADLVLAGVERPELAHTRPSRFGL